MDAKLQIKPGRTVAVLDAPHDLVLEATFADVDVADAVVVFVKARRELETHAPLLRGVAGRGGLAWVAYPKARQLGTDLNRDTIHAWSEGERLTTVRQIAIDETWSAMRLKTG